MLTALVLAVATVLGDFSRPGHGWKEANHAFDGRQTATGYAYRVSDEDPWLLGPLIEMPPVPEGATLATFLLEAAVSGSVDAVFYWSLPDHPGSYSADRELKLERVDATHWSAELPIAYAPRGRVSLRLDIGNGKICPTVEMRRFSVEYVKPLWRGRGNITPPTRWMSGEGETLVAGDCRLVHSRETAGAFRFEAVGKVRAESGGDGPVVVMGPDGKPDAVVFAQPPAIERAAGGLSVRATGCDRAGRHWRIDRLFRAEADGIAVETTVSCDRPADVLHLPYLTLSVDRSSKGHKAQAMLPGLEYLGDEPSSNEKEIHGPESNRLIPDAAKLCHPLMVLTDGRNYFALRWRQPEGGDLPFSPVFDSPDRLFGTGGHLFALWAPATGRCRRESQLDILEPMKGFTSGRVKARLSSGPGATVAAALERLLPSADLPDLPTFDRDRAAELLAHGWLDSEIRRGDQVRHAVGSNFSFHRPVDAPALMRYLACMVKDPGLASRLEKVAAEMLAAFPKGSAQAQGIGTAVSHVNRPAAPLVYGDPFAFAAARKGNLEQAVRTLADGSRRWQPTAGRHDYGKTLDADHCNGFTAMAALPMVVAATWTGDEAAIRAALATVDKVIARYRGTVPCGAQPWEMPLHCPDIVASGELTAMCTSAWLLTGEERYLDEARYWARTGLSMVYLSEPAAAKSGFCGCYATVGVMGATNWASPNWMGRPVQWCGLTYAMELFELAAVERDAATSEYWRKIASGITLSGVSQSYPLEDVENQGLLPDSTTMSGQQRMDPPINPGTVEENLSWLLRKPYYRCVRAGKGSGAAPLVHVAGGVRARNGEATDLFRIAVDAWPTPSSKVFVTRVARPSKVIVDGVAVPFVWRDAQLSFEVPGRPAEVRAVRNGCE